MADNNEVGVTERDMLSFAARYEISPVWHAVLLYRNDCFIGVGTLYLNSTQREIIVTAGHLFQQDGQEYLWSFRRLYPLANWREPIASAAFVPGAEKLDIAFCVSGPLTPIRGFCPFRIGDLEMSNFTCHVLPKSFELRSLVSGKATTCGGKVVQGPVSYAVVPWNSLPGESGTGFVNKDGNLFVLKGSVAVMPNDCGVIGVPLGTERVSFLLELGRT